MKRTNTILAAAFLILLCTMVGYILPEVPGIYTDILTQWQAQPREDGGPLAKAEFAADIAEGELNAALDRGHHFIELYGLVQRLTGQRFVEDNYSYSVIRMNDGSLTFGSVGQIQKDVSHNAQSTADFAAALRELGIPFSAVITPQKVPQHTECVPAALRDYHNEEGDQFLALLEESGVHTVDLRDEMHLNPRLDFYVTDHHWTAESAFEGNQILSAALAEEYGFPIFTDGLDKSRFRAEVHYDFFLGSQGKRVGTRYAGVDDFVLYHPDFDTDMSYFIRGAAEVRTGTLADALYFTEHLKQDYYNGNPYVTFAGGDWGKATVINHNNPEGPKMVMIRDSFGCAITPFLALQCSELTTIDLRAYGDGDFMADIREIDPDLVVLLYNPSTLVTDSMFAFFDQ